MDPLWGSCDQSGHDNTPRGVTPGGARRTALFGQSLTHDSPGVTPTWSANASVLSMTRVRQA